MTHVALTDIILQAIQTPPDDNADPMSAIDVRNVGDISISDAIAQGHQRTTRRRRRNHGHDRLGWTDRRLIELREARHLAGLDTNELDAMIAVRILANHRTWRYLGVMFVLRGWVDDIESVT
jgi:hypothetical protein